MAENTYKKPKVNKDKGKEKAGIFSKFRSIFNFFKDKRLHLAAGFFLIMFSFSMFIGFVSYLFTGSNDQSVVEGLFSSTIKDSGEEAQNWLGLAGALISYLFIFDWFGIASFLFIPLFFLSGLSILMEKKIANYNLIFTTSSFFIFWISLTLGYLVLKINADTSLNFLCGGIGFEMALISDSLLGWGTTFLLMFFVITFLIYFFNITTLRTGKIMQSGGIVMDQKVEEDISDILANERVAAINEQEESMQEDAWLVKMSDAKPKKESLKGDPVLSIEEPALKEEIMREVPPFESEFIVQDAVEEEPADISEAENYDPTLDLASYKYPPIELLNEVEVNKVQVTKEELEANKDKIVETLSHYSIGITSIKATIGPTVTLYEIVPDAGIRISKIKNLEDDIALSLAALGIRIIAPIPGKGTIGIEVPNKNREMVSCRSVLSTEKFLKSDKELPIVFGKTISNEIFVIDLAKMPHLLMAGATGQGKSVGLNVLLTSLIYKKHPSQLKFVLVDPKKVELSLFNKIERHFLAKLPNTEDAIITDTKKVVHTLNSLCIEMDMRYDLLKEANCRNLKEYNKKFVERKLNPQNGHRFLPYIVLVIDELADLMMTAGKEVETPIARLAQLARAIGIHLVVATQRPSVNVITGIIKANFPARLSFKVTSKVDSRTILDTGGADQLVGQGDMLFSNGSELIRLQCAFVDTAEVERICDYIGSQRGYDSAYSLPEFSDEDMIEDKGDFKFSDRDSLFEEAAKTIVMHQQGSTSLLQRRLKLGYNRAGRLIDQLEAAGIVGPFEGSKAREVLIRDEISLEQLLSDLNKKG
jgi:S-DNA-T family DNA segregation ATPase FtsK/SpoIIIE